MVNTPNRGIYSPVSPPPSAPLPFFLHHRWFVRASHFSLSLLIVPTFHHCASLIFLISLLLLLVTLFPPGFQQKGLAMSNFASLLAAARRLAENSLTASGASVSTSLGQKVVNSSETDVSAPVQEHASLLSSRIPIRSSTFSITLYSKMSFQSQAPTPVSEAHVPRLPIPCKRIGASVSTPSYFPAPVSSLRGTPCGSSSSSKTLAGQVSLGIRSICSCPHRPSSHADFVSDGGTTSSSSSSPSSLGPRCSSLPSKDNTGSLDNSCRPWHPPFWERGSLCQKRPLRHQGCLLRRLLDRALQRHLARA
jgi:hypothetical protein